jgi:hypothetical protein
MFFCEREKNVGKALIENVLGNYQIFAHHCYENLADRSVHHKGKE